MLITHLFKFSHVLISFFTLVLLVSCGGGSGGGADTDNNQSFAPDFRSARIISQTSMIVDPVSGGVIEHAGATLTIPPGALGESAQIGLASTTLPVTDLPANDGALLGRTVLSKSGIVITSDKDIHLNRALTLRLPIELSKVPVNTVGSEITISTDTGGFLVPQGSPDSVNLTDGFLEFTFGAGQFFSATNNKVLGPPRGIAMPFLVVLTVAGSVQTINPVIATLDSINLLRYDTIFSDHFTIHYNLDAVTLSKVFAVMNNSIPEPNVQKAAGRGTGVAMAPKPVNTHCEGMPDLGSCTETVFSSMRKSNNSRPAGPCRPVLKTVPVAMPRWSMILPFQLTRKPERFTSAVSFSAMAPLISATFGYCL
ncbi:MAG: hypothetical protein V3W04_01035 [Gammaproteobacteria bacterium]